MWASILCSRVRLAGTYLEEIASLPIRMRLSKQLFCFEQLARRNALTESQVDLAISLGVSRQSIYQAIYEWQSLGVIN